MAKKNSYRQRRREQEARRQRLMIIGGVVVVAILAVVIFIAASPRPQAAVGDFTTVPTQTWPNETDKSMGPTDAKVVVQEFADFQCPYCGDFHSSIFPKIVSDYVDTGKVRFEYHHLIVIDQNVGGNELRKAAQASECAAAQNRFWDYYNMLFANQQTEGSGAFSDTRLKAFAAALGLDTNQFNACFDSSKYAANVVQDEQLAAQNQLNSTPSLLVNGVKVQNPLDYTSVQTAINTALQNAGQ